MDSRNAERQALAEILLRRELSAARERTAIRPRPAPDLPAPLSVAQWRIWFMTRLYPDSAAYNEVTAVRVRGVLNHAAVERSVAEAVARHEILRTRLVMADGHPAQIANATAAVRLRRASFAGLPSAAREQAALDHIRAAAAEPFRLDQAPLLRLDLADLGDDEAILAVTLHHLVSDGWSVRLLLAEIMERYAAHVSGRPPGFPPLPIQYADYAVWQREQLERGGAIAGQLDYWRSQLAGVPHDSGLPTDRPRPPTQTYAGAEHAFSLQSGLVDRLRELGRSERATLFMTLLAAFQALLARYSGSTDIVVGTPVANRSRAELGNLVGCFINTIALRSAVPGQVNFRELLTQVRETVIDGFAHQEVPFDRVVEAVGPPRDPSRTPLFQVMLVLHNQPHILTDLPGLQVSGVTGLDETAKLDLTLALVETPDGLEGHLEYNTDLFDPGTAERMAGDFGRLLAELASDPDRPVGALPLLSSAEREAVRRSWQAPLPLDATECVHQIFERQAAATPDAVAVVDGDRQVSYRQLDEAAAELAARLRVHGLEAGRFAALCLERSLDLVVSVLAVLKAGGAYVPLDPAEPAERLAFVLSDAEPVLLLTQAQLLPRLPAGIVPTLVTGADAVSGEAVEAPAGGGTPAPSRPARPGDLAYMIYTSGTTGRPKGVLVEHRHLTRLFGAASERFELRADDVWTLLHSYCFDISVFEMWAPLLHGGRLVIVPRAVTRSPGELRRLAADQQVTAMCQTPTIFGGFIGADRHEPTPDLVLRLVILGGERLDPRCLGDWFARHPDDAPQIVNMLGPTETTVYAMFRRMVGPDSRSPRSYVGRALPDMRVLVVDQELAPVPPGVLGELLIAGAGVARGYHRRPRLTAERFVPDPMGGGWRCYRTGDLVRQAPDGDIEYLRRADNQVKVRGHRVELDEIEVALRAHPGVADAVVSTVTDAGSGVRLVAHAVASTTPPPTVRDLRAFLATRLPEHMMPSALAYLPALPLTVNGKVNRAALPPVQVEQSAVGEVYVAPRTKAERALALAWKELLDVDRVGIDDNFFELGGHSVLAIQLHEQLRDIQVDVDVLDIFACPTVRRLAERVTLGGHDGGALQAAHERAARRRAARRDHARLASEGR